MVNIAEDRINGQGRTEKINEQAILLIPSIFFFQAPITESLILYNDPEISDLSVQCFMSECCCRYKL